MIEKILESITSVSSLTREICGVIVNIKGRAKFIQCRNLAEDNNDFILHPQDLEKAKSLGSILYIVHTHISGSHKPTETDIYNMDTNILEVPWLIVDVVNNTYGIYYPASYTSRLDGREYIYGKYDCFSLVRDFYSNLGIFIPDHIRLSEWLESDNTYSPYDELHQQYGFIKVDEPKPNDIIIMKCTASSNLHIAIYIGNNKILHHCINRLSCIDNYSGYWREVTSYFLRYNKCLET
jgi:cell wall-associated NlpC family hydrolase